MRYDPPRTIDAKGLGRIDAHPAVELLAALPTQRRGIGGLRAPLIGRDRELRLLVDSHRKLEGESSPFLVTVFGNAGVGKSRLVDEFVETIFALEAANRDHPEVDDLLDGARYVQTTVIDAMAAVREVADRLEKVVPDDLWPLPKYSEVLFIK